MISHSKKIEFIVPGVPKAQPRPRVRKAGDKAWAYYPKGVGPWKESLAAYCSQNRPSDPIEGPIRLDVSFFLPRPKNMKSRMDCEPHIKKPDSDNLLKAVMDSMNDIFWNDDSQVCDVRVRKFYAEGGKEGALITLEW